VSVEFGVGVWSGSLEWEFGVGVWSGSIECGRGSRGERMRK